MDYNAMFNNPLTQIGLGIMGAGGAGVSGVQQIGRGGLLGIQNYQRTVNAQELAERQRQAALLQQQELKLRQQRMMMEQEAAQRQQESLQAQQEWVSSNMPQFANAPPSLQKAAFESAFAAPKNTGFGTTVQYAIDKKTKERLPMQASESGGLAFRAPDGTLVPFDPAKHTLSRPMTLMDLQTGFLGFDPLRGPQPLTGQAGGYTAEGGGYIPTVDPNTGKTILEPEEVEQLSPSSQYQPKSQSGMVMKGLKPSEDPGLQAEQVKQKEQAKLAVEKKAKRPKALSALNAFKRESATAINQINKIREVYSPAVGTATGVPIVGNLPMTAMRTLQNRIKTLKAIIGFQSLQEMRANSPTGGALGQVAVQELEYLQAKLGTLDPASAEFETVLGEIETTINQMTTDAETAFQSDFGGAGGWSIRPVR